MVAIVEIPVESDVSGLSVVPHTCIANEEITQIDFHGRGLHLKMVLVAPEGTPIPNHLRQAHVVKYHMPKGSEITRINVSLGTFENEHVTMAQIHYRTPDGEELHHNHVI